MGHILLLGSFVRRSFTLRMCMRGVSAKLPILLPAPDI